MVGSMIGCHTCKAWPMWRSAHSWKSYTPMWFIRQLRVAQRMNFVQVPAAPSLAFEAICLAVKLLLHPLFGSSLPTCPKVTWPASAFGLDFPLSLPCPPSYFLWHALLKWNWMCSHVRVYVCACLCPALPLSYECASCDRWLWYPPSGII